MTNEIAKFDVNYDTKTLDIEFSSIELNDENVHVVLDQFEKECHQYCLDEKIDFVVISSQTNAGPGFCFHAYFKEALDVRVISKWEKIVVFLERLKKITIITLEGPASEVMMQLALVCDHRICTQNTAFRFSAIQSGYLPGMAIFRLSKYIGLGHAKKMLYSGQSVNADQAFQFGLVDEIVVDPEESARKFIKAIHPKQEEAIIMARRLLNESYHDSYEEEIGDYLAAQVRCIEHLNDFK